jgi:hypothetical protein
MTKPAGDEYMGKYVYCRAHVGPHATGWCTVPPEDKIALKATTAEDAYAEVKANGWRIYRGSEGFEGDIDP